MKCRSVNPYPDSPRFRTMIFLGDRVLKTADGCKAMDEAEVAGPRELSRLEAVDDPPPRPPGSVCELSWVKGEGGVPHLWADLGDDEDAIEA